MAKTIDKGKMSSSGSLIKEAEQLSGEDNTDNEISPVQLIKRHIIAADEACLAKDMLTIQRLENQKRIQELKRDMDGGQPNSLRNQATNTPTTVLGTAQTTPPIVSILNSLPEADRKDFLEKNKEAIFSQSVQTNPQGSMMAQLLARQQPQTTGGTDLNGFANLLLAVNAMSESRAQSEREMMLNMVTMMAKTTQPAPSSGNDGAIAKLLERLNNKFEESQSAIKGEIDSIKQGYQQQLIEAQKTAMDNQMKLVETQYAGKLDQLQKMLEAKQDQQSFAQNIQGMIAKLQEAGVNVTTESAEQERVRREYTLKEKELDLKAEADARRSAIELKNAEARQQMWAGVGSIVSSGMEAMRVQKAIEKGGSTAARKITGRA